jgi:Fe-S-cluster-containing hydrogenase component 2
MKISCRQCRELFYNTDKGAKEIVVNKQHISLVLDDTKNIKLHFFSQQTYDWVCSDYCKEQAVILGKNEKLHEQQQVCDNFLINSSGCI